MRVTGAKQEVKNRVGDSPAIARGIKKKKTKRETTEGTELTEDFILFSALSVFSG